MSDDIVARLREVSTSELADEIERLCAERDALRALLVRSRAWIVDGKRDFNDELADEIDAAVNKGGGE